MARCGLGVSVTRPFEERSVGLELLSRLREAHDGSHEGGSEEGRAKKHAHCVPLKQSPPENAARESATKSRRPNDERLKPIFSSNATEDLRGTPGTGAERLLRTGGRESEAEEEGVGFKGRGDQKSRAGVGAGRAASQ